MPHFITQEECNGCSACCKKCPVEAISGVVKQTYAVDPSLCIDCGICGNVCPKGAVRDSFGAKVPRMKLSKRPKAEVERTFCTGCGFCEEVCPVEAIEMEKIDFYSVALVDEKRCVGCGLCTTVCAKGAISDFEFMKFAQEESILAQKAGLLMLNEVAPL